MNRASLDRIEGRILSYLLPPCARCGHPPDWHRLDDSTNVSPVDPAAKFRCIGYDCTADGPPPRLGRACWCSDYSDEFVRVRAAFTRSES